MSAKKPQRQTPKQMLARAFRLDDEGWARHANPWSGWTRIVTGLPVLLLMVWSLRWAPLWAIAIVPVGATWLWLNPRLFAPARDDSAWASRAVFGERLWIEQPTSTLPQRYVRRARWLNALAAIGIVPALVGVWIGAPVMAVTGAVVSFIGKFAFIDQMERMYAEMTSADPSLRYSRPS